MVELREVSGAYTAAACNASVAFVISSNISREYLKLEFHIWLSLSVFFSLCFGFHWLPWPTCLDSC